ncbi:DNA-formamidopyrimidine glycosylase family protein [Miniimonas arenae]|uniref:DNA-formamidopyrimidine glycosylase family protein n=1 Tax=Miniimonas arenae TaxID=676201 RepID=UPI0028A5B7FA|nr:DNA-formamidopyrimidine glycosylase family protein [Miniimonas arenae]
MPEGDVLLRAARRLTAALADEPLVRGELRWPAYGGLDLAGLRSLGTVSYGKHLLTRFDDGSTLHTHLRMDGTWRVEHAPGLRSRDRDPNVRAVLATTRWTCRGYLLGMVDVVRTRDERDLIGHLGPHLLADDAEEHVPAAAAVLVTRAPATVGAALLDQTVAAGIGTIWMAETLFRHRINPWRPVADLRVDEATALLTTASRLMLTSANSPAAPGTRGSVPIAAHGREGRPCPRCGTPIAVGRVGTPPQDRPAFFCPACQPR